MGHEGQEILIKDALVFLVAAGMIIPILKALRLPTVAGFILAGVALGPNGIGALAKDFPILAFFSISEPEAAAPFAELGVLFLLFLLGLELSLPKLWALRRVVFGAGLVQAGVSTLAISGVAYLLGLSPPAAVLVGLALALSSTAIVMQLLIDNKKTASPIGRTALGILLLQDILVAPILIFAGFAGRGGGGDLPRVLLEAAVDGLVAITVIFLIGRYVLRKLFQLAARTGGRDFLMAITLLTVVGAAIITGGAGLSIALGAFLAGLLLGETEFKHQAEVDLEPFKGLLLGLFFMTVGFSLNLSVIAEQWPIVLGGVVALLLIKVVATGLAIRSFVGNTPLSLEGAFLLAPAGEFAFVVLATAGHGDILADDHATLIAAIAGISMLLNPLMWLAGRWFASKCPDDVKSPGLPNDYSTLEGHVIIAGCGRVGRAVAGILEREQAEIVALDLKADAVAKVRKAGRKVYLGDGSRAEVLAKVGLSGASMLVVTLDDPKNAEKTVRAARKMRPDLPVLVRAQDADHSRQLYEAGATFVALDAIEAGLQMSARALEQIGYDGETVRGLIAAERHAEYERAARV